MVWLRRRLWFGFVGKVMVWLVGGFVGKVAVRLRG